MKRVFLAVALAFLVPPAQADPAPAVATTQSGHNVLSDGIGPAQGAFRSRTQVVFLPRTQAPEARHYEVFDPDPARSLDFSWAADNLAADRPGRISGSGRLVWRLRDSAAYDESAIVSAYRGSMKDGKAHGAGLLAHRNGLIYDGQWRNGRAHGRGRLILPDGAEYQGEFRNGFAEGRGIFTENTWEQFEGAFARGLRYGTGKTTLPSGLAYESDWRAGQETPNSYRIRVAQLGAAPAVGATEDVKFGITMRRTPRLPEGIKATDLVLYAAESTPIGLRVVPSDKKLVDRWLNNATLEDPTMEAEISPVRYGLFGVENGYVQPVAFNLTFSNTGNQPIEVQRLEIRSTGSREERTPALDVKSGFCAECMVSYAPEFSLYNYGIAAAEKLSIRYAFASPGTRPPENALSHVLEGGTVAGKSELSVEAGLARERVNIKALDELRGSGLQCPSQNAQACLRTARQNPIFGNLAQRMTLKNNTLIVQMTGTVSYSFIDHAGARQQKSVPISLPIGLANIYALAEGGSDGPPKALRAEPLRLKIDAAPYTLPVPFRTTIAPGRTANFTLQLDAEKSSWHDFRFAARLSNGTEILSPPINMLYFKPREILNN